VNRLFDVVTRRTTLKFSESFFVRGYLMPILCRPARAQDLERADELVAASFNDFTQRHGFGAIATSHPPNFQLFSLKDDAGGLWMAEEAGEILGFAWSWVCGDLWFLAQLFVSPGHHGLSNKSAGSLVGNGCRLK
jgi:hypothetical protein